MVPSFPWAKAGPNAPPREDEGAWDRRGDHYGEEEKPCGERRVLVDPEAAEEEHEERLTDTEPVDRDWDHHHEEEKRSEDDVDEQRNVYPDRLATKPDREYSDDLDDDRRSQGEPQRAWPRTVLVKRSPDRVQASMEPEPAPARKAPLESGIQLSREEKQAGDDEGNQAAELDPDKLADVS